MGRRLVATLALLGTAAAFAQSATVSGKVTLRQADGSAPSPSANVLVYVTGYEEPAPSDVPKLVQKNKSFVPEVLPIVQGQTVEFPNEDAIVHNVFSKSHAASFDLGKYTGTSKRRTFEKTGKVELYCDIHETMASTIMVLPNRAFALAGTDGAFTIKNVRPGNVKVFAWAVGANPTSSDVIAEAGKEHAVNLDLVVKTAGAHLDKHQQAYKKRGSY